MKIIFMVFVALILNASSIEFNNDEKNFIKNHPVIKVGIDLKFHTIDAIDWDGNHIGISSDYLKIITKESGLKFDLIALDSFDITLQKIKNKKIDMIAAIYKTEYKSKHLVYSDPYVSVPFYIYTKEETPTIKNLDNLDGSKICVLKGFMTALWLEKNYPNIRAVEALTIYDALEKVSRGEAVAFINDYASTSYSLKRVFLPNMKLNAPVIELNNVPIAMGVRPDYTILRDIINKINTNLSEKNVEKLRAKWFSNGKISMLNFSKKERIWIEKHSEIVFSADPNWLPFEGYNSTTAQYYGIANDILTIVSSRTGLKFKLLQASTWNEAKQQIKDGKSQMIPTISSVGELKDYLNVSEPYMKIPYLIYGIKNSFIPSSLKELAGKKVALIEDSSAYKNIKKYYPNITRFPVENTQELFTLLTQGRVDYFISNRASASYAINSANIEDIIGLTELDMNYSPKIAISKKFGLEAISVIDKAIESISEEEIQDIYNKWIFVKANESRDKKIPIIFYIVTASIFLAGLFLLWKKYFPNNK
ncbi:MAG: transporter substrate-binding domain-containing protein [Sulfurimonas sp.]|nr:transporter substrate-binding domain-containing protein [Sulfurimonas sp.]